ncbi:MAG: nuclear transport factor 2 family protein [Acidimicrobiales bacterium]
MMSLHRVETVRRAFDMFEGHNFDEILELLDPDVQWPDFRDGSVLIGRDAVRRYWDEIFAVATPSVLVGDVFELNDEVLAVTYQQLYERDGRPVGSPSATTIRFTFRGPLICKAEASRVDEVPEEIRSRFATNG